jgi:outer membrane protein assembly factor BamB
MTDLLWARLCLVFLSSVALATAGCGGTREAAPAVPQTQPLVGEAFLQTDRYSTSGSLATHVGDWDSYAYDLQRSGYNPNEKTVGIQNVGSLAKLWTAQIGDHAMREPVLANGVTIGSTAVNVLYSGSGGGAALYAINAATGATIWKDTEPSQVLPCQKSTLPFSVEATPAIDRIKNLIYFSDGTSNVHAVDLSTGKEQAGWPITLATDTVHENIHGGMTYNPANGMLYAVTSSLCDFYPWHGRIVAINTKTASIVGTFFTVSGTSTSGGSGGGVWGAGGASIDPGTNDVLIATGNASVENGQAENAGYAEHLVVLTPDLSKIVGANYPPNIPGGSLTDLDFGSTPMLFEPPGCPEMTAALNKSGMFELYDLASLEKSENPVQGIQMSIASDTADFQGTPAYDPVTNYLYIALPTTFGGYKPGLAAFSIRSTCTIDPTPVWYAAFGPDGATTPDQTERSGLTIANGVIYVGSGPGDMVYAFNAATGAELWSTNPGGRAKPATIVTNGVVYVSADDGEITAWAPSPSPDR